MPSFFARLSPVALVLPLLCGAPTSFAAETPVAPTAVAEAATPPAPPTVAATSTSMTALSKTPPDLPVDAARLMSQYEEARYLAVRNLLSLDTVNAAIVHGDDRGLRVDLTGVTRLIDNTPVDPLNIYGEVTVGPHPFEAGETDYAYKRFRRPRPIENGEGLLELSYLMKPRTNSEGWINEGRVCARFDLWLARDGRDRRLGTYDTFVSFRIEDGAFRRGVTVVEGPFVGLVHSDNPGRATIAFQTDVAVAAAVAVEGGERFAETAPTRNHRIVVTGLKPRTTYRYRVEAGGAPISDSVTFVTAPEPGQGPVTFAYSGDSREGAGGGMNAYMGMNYNTLERLMSLAFARGADIFVMGGDLVNGYTTEKDDFEAQLRAWKQAATGFWRQRPIYPCMGNHEALLRVFSNARGDKIAVDRWPYETDSAEAVFADMFLNPENGPAPSDPRRPPYAENVYSLQYGPLKIIAFNNNYWLSRQPELVGGAPEGFLFDDQLEWLAAEIERADRDETVRYIVLFAQEPVFPNGGHVKDSMWHHGDNNVRAYTHTDAGLAPAKKGMIEVRNEFARMVAASPKVAAVLGSDEHAYHRVLITNETPVGDTKIDDKNGNGKIDAEETVSPLSDLRHPVWYIVSGGAGAPYYSEEETPWNRYWRSHKPTGNEVSGFFYSSQENVLIFHADETRMSLRTYNPYGELVDLIDDLMKVKTSPPHNGAEKAPLTGAAAANAQ